MLRGKDSINSYICRTNQPERITILMILYSYFVNALIIIAAFAAIRHLFYRSRFLLHMFQQSGYKISAFWKWLRVNWADKVFTTEIAWTNIVVLSLVLIREYITETSLYAVMAVFVLIWFAPVGKYRKKEKKKLAFTPRMKRLTAVFTALLLPFPIYMTYLALFYTASMEFNAFLLLYSWILMMVADSLIIMVAATIVMPVEKQIQEGFKKQARKKLASMPNLTVIGITGSYGKTSTKFMIRDILKERFQVLATPGSYNTPMGICKVINNDLQSQHQVLVLEMGARHVGNIKELCELAQPDISVLTIIGTAHLETFGSIENIAKTKGEIVENMNPDGTIVINADDERCEGIVKGKDQKIIRAGIENGEITASDIEYGPEGCSFTAHFPDASTHRFTTPLLGEHNVQNLVLAIGIGHHLGLRPATMAVALQKMKPVEHRLELKKTGNGINIIDDAFNSNPIGAKNAVDILAGFKSGRRAIVTPGMIELGDQEFEENKKLGGHIADAGLEVVIFVGKNQTRHLQEGYKEANGDEEAMMVVNSLFEANEFLKSWMREGDTILYENDLPDSYNE